MDMRQSGLAEKQSLEGPGVYVREATSKEQMQGVVPVTQFGRMCQRLGIRIIAANSAQAAPRASVANTARELFSS